MNQRIIKIRNKSIIFLVVLIFCHSGNAQKLAKYSVVSGETHSSEDYQSMTFNGVWTWFNDPRAVYFEGKHKRTYAGWIDNYGDIHVGYYDHETKEIRSKTLYDNLEIDDHDNPSLLFDEEGRLLVFFTTHMIGVKPIHLMKSTNPEDIDSWGEVKKLYLNDEANRALGGMAHTYANPVKLSAEKGRIYLFWRGVDGKPSFSTSDDNGETWAKGKIFFMPERFYQFRRPYTKIYSDGVDKIHITVTDGHPRDEKENSIYYMCYKGGAFYKADGTKIKDVESLPILPSEADMVYDAKEGKAKAWNWDVAADQNGNPIIAYAKFPNDSNHIYSYAFRDKNKWKSIDLINSGGWYPETREGQIEPEPNYSGGITIDHESPNTLYLSVKRDSIFEIEKWVTGNNGKSWQVEKITSGSSKNNVRLVAVRGAKEGNPVQVLWMQNTRYWHFAVAQKFQEMGGKFEDRLHGSIKMSLLSPGNHDPLTQAEILNVMHQTADWQFANPVKDKRASALNWHYGVFYSGVRALCELSGDKKYKDELINIGQSNDWKPMNDIFNADRLTIVDTWAWLYSLEKDPKMIDKAQWALDIHLARKYKENTIVSLKNNPLSGEWWSWCDALFMAPPAFAGMWKVTGNIDYLNYLDTQWWKTSDYLYSKEDSLFYRDDRYFDKLSDNGKKVFWGRGNGWVIAGLAKVLTILPEDFPNRSRFEQQYKEMAAKMLSLQDKKDGLWRVSLYDPEFLNIGESSCSALFTYALAWGINNGLLDRKYKPNVEKAWIALCHNVNSEGRLGFVQQVAGDPSPFKENQWHVYATGAFLMAGKEVYQLETK